MWHDRLHYGNIIGKWWAKCNTDHHAFCSQVCSIPTWPGMSRLIEKYIYVSPQLVWTSDTLTSTAGFWEHRKACVKTVSAFLHVWLNKILWWSLGMWLYLSDDSVIWMHLKVCLKLCLHAIGSKKSYTLKNLCVFNLMVWKYPNKTAENNILYTLIWNKMWLTAFEKSLCFAFILYSLAVNLFGLRMGVQI